MMPADGLPSARGLPPAVELQPPARLRHGGGSFTAHSDDSAFNSRRQRSSWAQSDQGDTHLHLSAASCNSSYEVSVDGTPVRLALDADRVTWAAAGGGDASGVLFSEIIGVRELDTHHQDPTLCIPRGPRLHALALFSFRRDERRPCDWHPRRLTIQSASEEAVASLAARISEAVEAAAGGRRPRSLLVIINPCAGTGQARAAYRALASPVFAQAGVALEVVETQAAGQAERVVRQLAAAAAAARVPDGVVVVGGDGIFNEVLNGLMRARTGAAPARAAQLATLRLAHLPAGSTDALACSLHGTRSVFTAACHVALGDCLELDVLRVRVGGAEERFACCIATCGFMADVVRAAERHRWAGPLRYDVAGAAALAAGRSYRCRVGHAAGEAARGLEAAGAAPCGADCGVCRAAALGRAQAAPAAAAAGAGAAIAEAEWAREEGDFLSIMLIVQPCVAGRTPHGMARHGHLADGRLVLVLVRRCSPPRYLSFLRSMSARGLAAGEEAPMHVQVVQAEVCEVESLDGNPLAFNLDGELVYGASLRGDVLTGPAGVRVFARGVERAG